MLDNVKDGSHPTLIEPILIHERKTEETYSIFCGSLKALQPEIGNLLAFGTDDEQALTNAFNKNLEHATHLLCEIHLKKNVERKLIGPWDNREGQRRNHSRHFCKNDRQYLRKWIIRC